MLEFSTHTTIRGESLSKVAVHNLLHATTHLASSFEAPFATIKGKKHPVTLGWVVKVYLGPRKQGTYLPR